MANIDKRNIQNRSYQDNSNRADLADAMTERKSSYDPASYNNGYAHGRASERRVADVEERVRAREGESAASGLFVGIILTALVGLGFGLFYFLNNESNTPNPNVVPNIVNPQASPNQTSPNQTRSETTIIERDRVVPVPQEAPNPQVNIEVPNPANGNNSAPIEQTAPEQPQDPASTSGAEQSAPADNN